MTANPYYRMINGEPMVSAAGLALLLGRPVEQLLAQQRSSPDGAVRLTDEQTKRGVRIRKEAQAALGYEAGMREVIDYLAEKA